MLRCPNKRAECVRMRDKKVVLFTKQQLTLNLYPCTILGGGLSLS